MEIRSQGVAAADRAGRAGQDEKRGLERILRVMRIAQDVAADAEHHRPMPRDQGGERQLGRLAAPGGKSLQELAVRQAGHRAGVEQGVKVTVDVVASRLRHGFDPADPWIS